MLHVIHDAQCIGCHAANTECCRYRQHQPVVLSYTTNPTQSDTTLSVKPNYKYRRPPQEEIPEFQK